MTEDEAARFAALEARVAALEERQAAAASAAASAADPAAEGTPAPAAVGGAAGAGDPPASGPSAGVAPDPFDGLDDEVFWALRGLKSRLPPPGGVLFTGSVTLPDGPCDWQEARLTDALLGKDWTELAAAIGALGHPVRLLLLQEVLNGRHAVSELGEDERFGTSGQLYHHLRQLVAAGWLRSSGRGTYAVPVQRVVPLLVIVFGADR